MIMVVRVAAITYLNTLPFVYGLERTSVAKRLEPVPHTPAQDTDILSPLLFTFNAAKKEGLSHFGEMEFDPSKFRVRW